MNKLANILLNHPEINVEDYQITDKDHKDIAKMSKEALELQDKIVVLQHQIASKKQELINSKYTPFCKRMGVYYSKTQVHYSWDTGNPEDPVEDTWYIEVSNINSDIWIALGFDSEKGAIIYGNYKITINSQRKILRKKFVTIYALPFFENDPNCPFTNWNSETPLVASEIFIKEMFGVEYQGKKTLKQLQERFLYNLAFENIVKECPPNIVDRFLDLYFKESMPFYKMLGLSKGCLKKIKEDNLLDTEINNFFNIRDHRGCYEQNEILEQTGLTEFSYIEMLKQCLEWEELLQFYDIRISDNKYRPNYYERNLLSSLIINWIDHKETLTEGYSFNKFCNYVVNETVNQGYESIGGFMIELFDYLSMCKELGAIPSYDSNFLKQTHDVTARNFKVALNQMEEETFEKRYLPYKDSKVGDYWIVVPKKSKDIKDEGNKLHHCVASYIKSIIDGKCLIFFLRKEKSESLVTFEVVDGKAVQVRGAKNRAATKEERDAIEKWVKKTYEKGTI